MKKNANRSKPKKEKDIDPHRPLTDGEWDAMGPWMHGIEGLPKVSQDAVRRSIGRPKSANPKQPISFRFSADIVEHLQQHVTGYNRRVEAVLRQAIDEGKI